MRFAAVILAVLIVAASVGGACVQPARAADSGARDEAMAMVRRVQERFRRDGAEATFRAINNRTSPFGDREVFPFVHRLDGSLCVANAGVPAVRGRNLHDQRDQDGKFIVEEFVKIANSPAARGWSDYRAVNSSTGMIEEKSAFIERMGDYFVGVSVTTNEVPADNTVGIVSGSLDDTYLQAAYDLADVLNDGDNLRVLPVAGVGGARNIRDVRNVRGVDIGLTQTNILNSFRTTNERTGQADDKIVYLAKLFNEEVHLVTRPDITEIGELKGLKVNLDASGGGTSYSMRDLLRALGIEVEEVSMPQAEAVAKVKSGEIAATAIIAGKPVRAMLKLTRNDHLHLLPIPYPPQIIGDYLPAMLTHDDYPELIAAGDSVDTVAVGAVLIAYNWPRSNAEHYRRIQRFVEAFFPRISELQKPPRHPKWREVNLAATLPGWQRFDGAQAWLDNQRARQQVSGAGAPGPAAPPALSASGSAAGAGDPPPVDPGLYQEFLKWRQLNKR